MACLCGKSKSTIWKIGMTRPSCIFCTEKHIGAAMVLYKEYGDGYKYYLLITGHLHEAEEESAGFMGVAEVIREQRLRFQKDRLIDFEIIAEALLLAKTDIANQSVTIS